MNQQFANIVEVVEGQAFTTTEVIARMTGNGHRGVIQLLRLHIDDFDEFGRVQFEMRPFETPGGVQQHQIALLNESQATLLMTYMRNSDVVRAFKRALVHAFAELKAKLAPDTMALLNDPAQLRNLLGNYSERVLELEHTVEEQRPKVQALDRIATSTDTMSITEAAKVLQMHRSKLFEWMQARGWIYRRTYKAPWLARQERIDAGLLVHKIIDRGNKDDGSPRLYDQVLVTAKGLASLARSFERAESSAERTASRCLAEAARVLA